VSEKSTAEEIRLTCINCCSKGRLDEGVGMRGKGKLLQLRACAQHLIEDRKRGWVNLYQSLFQRMVRGGKNEGGGKAAAA